MIIQIFNYRNKNNELLNYVHLCRDLSCSFKSIHPQIATFYNKLESNLELCEISDYSNFLTIQFFAGIWQFELCGLHTVLLYFKFQSILIFS